MIQSLDRAVKILDLLAECSPATMAPSALAARLRERLTAVSPLAVLNRGYALVYDGEEIQKIDRVDVSGSLDAYR